MKVNKVSVATVALCLAGATVSAQTINEDSKFVAGDAAAGAEFGFSVGFADGIAVAGAALDDENGNNAGAAYLIDTETHTQIAKALADDGAPGDQFGFSVGVSNGIVIVGARFDDDNGVDSGSAYLFDATTGTQIAKLLPSDGAAGDQFGYAVAIFGDTAIVGAPLNDDNGISSGAAYLFDTKTGTQIAKLLPADGESFDDFGFSVGIDGEYAIIGAVGDDDLGTRSGTAYLFDIFSATETTKLLADNGAAFDQFGFSVAIADGTAVVGRVLSDDGATNCGCAGLFDAVTGSLITTLHPDDAAFGNQFGFSVGIGGGVVVVGERFADDSGTDSGAAYFFDPQTGVLLNKILPSDGAPGDQFGFSVAAASGGAVFGAPLNDDAGASSGSIYFVEVPCLGDVNDDGTVNLADLNLVLANFGQSTPEGDANGDGEVDVEDLNAVLASFGTPCK